MASSELRALDCKPKARPFTGGSLDLIGLVTDDYRNRSGRKGVGGAKDVFDERKFCGLVQDLGRCWT